MKTLIARIQNVFLLSFLLPCVYGCNSGGGGSVSSLGALSGSDTSPFLAGPVLTFIGPDGTTPTLTNPEPATMLLLGTGIAAMTYIKSRQKKI